MAIVITMPRLSPTMEEGVLLKWTKKVGDKIAPGDVIAEVETDKANMDFPLEDEGTLLKLLVGEGDTVKLGAPVAVLGEAGEDAEAALAEAGGGGEKQEAKPAAKVEEKKEKPAEAKSEVKAEEKKEKKEAGKSEPKEEAQAQAPKEEKEKKEEAISSKKDEVAASEEKVQPKAEEKSAAGSLRASPLARKLAYEQGVDLKSVAGSGPGGRVVKRDIEEAAQRGTKPQAAPAVEGKKGAASAQAPTAGKPGEDQVIPLSPMRKTIARRLVESKQQVPHFYVTMDVAADAVWQFHAQVKAATDAKITLNDLIVKAVAVALRRVPEANASWGEGGITRHGRVDIGIAVSVEDGLVTPVVRNADQKSLGAIAAETRDLVDRARARKLRGDEFSGGTFSISNMGMLGVKAFSAVINPPEGGILAVGAVEKRAVVIEGEDGVDRIEARRMMTLTISADHRVVDGALAARLLGEIKRVLEHPFAMVL